MAKHYNKKFVSDVINKLKENGFICEKLPRNKNKFSISKKDGEQKIIHSGMSCYHPLRKWLKSTYNFDIESV